MIGRVLAIALNTYRESVRARVLLGLAGVAFAVALYALVVASYTLSSGPRVVSDLGAASISIFSVAVAVLVAATSLHRELEQKTIFPILARPITRGEYLVGKYAGTLLTLAVFILADAGLVLFLLGGLAGKSPALVAGLGVGGVVALALAAIRWPAARTFGPIPWAVFFCAAGAWVAAGSPDERRVVLGSAALAFLEIVILAALATFFSSFSTPFLSALMTLGLFLVGRSADTLAALPVKQFGRIGHDLGEAVSKVVPHLEVYVPPRPLLTGEAVGSNLGAYLGMATLWAAVWALVLLAGASLVFAKRDFL